MTHSRTILVVLAAAAALGCGAEQGKTNVDDGDAGGAGGSSGNGTGGFNLGGGDQSGGTSGSGGASGGSTSTGGSGGSNTDPCPDGAMCNGRCLAPGDSEGNCTLLAHADGQILALTLDDNYVYLAETTGVSRVPKSGSAPEMLAQTQDFARAVAVNSTQLFFSAGGISGSTVYAMPKAGGTPTPIDSHSDEVAPMVASDTRVFYFKVHFGGPSDVVSVMPDGTGALIYGTSDTAFDSLALDSTHVYWGDNPFSDSAHLWRSPVESAASEMLTTLDTVYNPVLSGDGVYFYESLSDGLYRVPKTGGTAQLVLSLPSPRLSNFSMFGNDTHVFWVTSTGISRVGYDGSSPEPVVDVDVEYTATADASAIYVVYWDYLLKVAL